MTSAHFAASATSIHLELLGFGLLHASRGLAERDRDLLDAAVAQIERVGVALAAIADDGDLLALDQVQVGIAIVINTHNPRVLLLLSDWMQAETSIRREKQARRAYIQPSARSSERRLNSRIRMPTATISARVGTILTR